MTDSKSNLTQFVDQSQISKQDLEIIFRVNEKVVQIQSLVADQNEEVISSLGKIADKQERLSETDKALSEKLEKILKQNEDLSRDVFKSQILYVVGILSILGNIISVLIKK
jgi:hypothetical protein